MIFQMTDCRKKAEVLRAAVCIHCGISPMEMDGPRGPERIAHPRMLAMYLVRKQTALSLVEIGKMFGRRDHGTVIHACRRIESCLDDDGDLRELINQIIGKEDPNQLKLDLGERRRL